MQVRLRPADRVIAAEAGRALCSYYRELGRRFPWRSERDPYRVAVAEILLQKTRAEVVVPALKELLDRYPAPAALSAAALEEIESVIRHLGLSNKRAAHLKHLGTYLALHGTGDLADRTTAMRVPGIGAYGASAIACFAHGRPLGIVDCNSRRIIARVFGVRKQTWRRLAALADAIALSGGDPRSTNYGLLDLGASVCTRVPKCQACPLKGLCKWARAKSVHRDPLMRAAAGNGSSSSDGDVFS
jgi:A/G-specific adenine glycosylase